VPGAVLGTYFLKKFNRYPSTNKQSLEHFYIAYIAAAIFENIPLFCYPTQIFSIIFAGRPPGNLDRGPTCKTSSPTKLTQT
jgi:hypothetical protein